MVQASAEDNFRESNAKRPALAKTGCVPVEQDSGRKQDPDEQHPYTVQRLRDVGNRKRKVETAFGD